MGEAWKTKGILNRGQPEAEIIKCPTEFNWFSIPFPGPAPPEGYAVIAYLHSGDFSNGSPFEINPHQLVFKQKVIVVTIAYRLNILGFFTSLDGEAHGNYGLMDQSAALFWIKRNIKAFGGDVDNVTLMGHGSGATSVCIHLTSKDWSEGIFHKAIIMSGTALGTTSIRPASYYARAVDRTAHAFSCFRRPTSQLIECLRRVDAKFIVENAPDQHWGPIIDEGLSNTTAAFIPDDPEVMLEHGKLMKIPILTGFTDMEEAYDLIAEDMVDNGISQELYDSMINEMVSIDFSRYENNDTMCGGNNQVVMEGKDLQSVFLSEHLNNSRNTYSHELPLQTIPAHRRQNNAAEFVHHIPQRPKVFGTNHRTCRSHVEAG